MTDTRKTSFLEAHPELLATLAERKMDSLEGELEMWRAATGQLYESLPLSDGLTLRREVTTSPAKSLIVMSYQTGAFLGSSRWYERVTTTPEGNVVYEDNDSYGHSEGQPFTGFKRAILTFKLLKGRPDHWDRESDFWGSGEE